MVSAAMQWFGLVTAIAIAVAATTVPRARSSVRGVELTKGSTAVGAAPSSAARPGGDAPMLRFSELLEGTPRGLRPSLRLQRLAGERVRIAGFMAQMDQPPSGSFYLVPRPLHCDEAGAGTADIPPEAVRVVVRSAAGKPVAFVPGPLEARGVLEVGSQADGEGRVSAIRVVLDAI